MRSRLALVLIALVATSAPSQSRPESAASRPDKKLTVRRVPFPIEGYASVPASASFSPDGRFLAVARGYDHSELRIFDFARKALEYDLSGRSAANFPPAFHPRSDELAYTVERGVSTVRLADGVWKPGRQVKLPKDPWVNFPTPRVLPWSRDGAEMMFVEGGEAHLVDWGRSETRRIDCGDGRPWQAVWLGQEFGVLLCGEDGSFATAIVRNGLVTERLPGVGILACSADGGSWLVAMAKPGAAAESRPRPRAAVEVWDGPLRRARAHLDLRPDDFTMSHPLCHGAFSASGHVLVTGDFKQVDVRDGRSGAVLHTITYYAGDRVVAVALSPDGRHLLTMGRPTVRYADGIVLWDLAFE